MTNAFGETPPVINYGPDCRPYLVSKGASCYVLWPALAYRVVAPQLRRRRFDLFQEAILKICRAGVVTVEEIHAHIQLGCDLIAFITLQLQSTGLLDDRLGLTSRALRLLEEDDDSTMEATVGHVFQDPISGALWPRFMTRPMDRVAAKFWPEGDGVRRCKYDIGSVGSRRDGIAIVIETGNAASRPAAPSATSVLRACREHRRQRLSYERVRNRGPEAAEELARFSASDLPAFIQQVSLVSTEPEPVYLCTFIFVPSDVSRTGVWQICDPFGLGVSAQLRQTAEGLIESSNGAALKRAVKKARDGAFAVEKREVMDARVGRRQSAERAVQAQLDDGIQAYPEFLQHLYRLEDAAVEIEIVKGKPGQSAEGLVQQAMATWFARAHTVLEELLAIVQRAYPPAATLEMLSHDAEWNASQLSQIALKKLHFADDEQYHALGFLKAARGKLDNVVHFGGRDLRSQVAVAVTAANDDSSHPLYGLAKAFPSWLSFLAELTDRRRRSVHADRGLLDASELGAIREHVYQSIRLLLPGLHEPGDQMPDACGGDVEAWQLEVMHRLRHQASAEVEQRTGLGFGQHPELQRFMVEMQTAATELRHLDGTTCPETIVAEICAEVVMKGACATEAVLQLLLAQSQPLDPGVGTEPERCHGATELSRLARELGFRMAEGKLLPECLSMAREGELDATFSRRKGTISAMAMVLVQEACVCQDHPFAGLARGAPGFLLSLAGIVQQRGHGGSDVWAGRDDALELVESVYGIAEAVLQVTI